MEKENGLENGRAPEMTARKMFLKMIQETEAYQYLGFRHLEEIAEVVDKYALSQTTPLREQSEKLQEENKKLRKILYQVEVKLEEQVAEKDRQLEEKDREIEKWKREAESLDGKLTDWINIESHANQSAAGWISVEDRLPENNVEVLIFSDSGRSMGVYDGFCRYLKSPGFYDLQMWSDAFGYEEDKKVTHWMPLPSPPSLQENTKF